MKLVANGMFDTAGARTIVPELDVVQVESTDEMLSEAADAEIVIGAAPNSFSELIRRGRRLKWVHTASAGVDHFLCPEFTESDVVLTCAKDGPAGPNLAEHAFGLLLALTRHVAIAARQTTWQRRELAGGVWELGGKTLGVVGYGGVGRGMAARGLAFGMSVVATKRRVAMEDAPADITLLPADRLHELLGQSDAVMIAVPDTPETRGSFDSTAFRAMKPSAILVNVGRGTTVVTDDLVDALREDRIAGAGLDVTDPEPLPDGHPLWSMDQVVITPHIAGAAPERGVRNSDRVMENLRRFISGSPLLGAVDRTLGY